MDNADNIKVLFQEIDWLQEVINQSLASYFLHENHESHWYDIPLPDLSESDSPYAKIVETWQLNKFERLALALTLVIHLRPSILDIFFGKNQIYDRVFTEFGGVIDKAHSGFLPTGQTFIFVTSAANRELLESAMAVLRNENILMKEQVLQLGNTEDHIPNHNATLSLSKRWFHYLITGEKLKIEHSASFPAKRITTKMEWEDIVLNDYIMEQVKEIETWINHGDTLLHDWGLGKKIKPGYRALFYGAPGTGKTLTATLLGKATQRDVYKVDLSMIVSKYIGETEKNLSKVFDVAQYKDWILFFDEADALFGRRTEANSSNDRHANQQTAYLLQRIEDFPGVVILASNLKGNMDDAFTRRFQSMIRFAIPTPEERYLLWRNAFSGKCSLDESIDIWNIAEKYELTGGSIINVLRYCALSAIKRGNHVISMKELLAGIKREFKKENKTIRNMN